MTAADQDPALKRFERDALVACLGTAVVAGAATRGRLDVVLGVAGGGLLMALSYRAIKGGVDVLAEAARRAGDARREDAPGGGPAPAGGERAAGGAEEAAPAAAEAGGGGQAGDSPQVPGAQVLSRGRKVALAAKFFARYALLAVTAYVMLMCFRLHPVGLVAGALAPFLAGVMQVVRLSRARARRRHS